MSSAPVRLSQVAPALLREAAERNARDIERAQDDEDAESRYRDLYNLASDPIYCVDAETFTIVDLNQTACDALGYTRDEVIGQPLRLVDDHVDDETLAAYIREMETTANIVLETHEQANA